MKASQFSRILLHGIHRRQRWGDVFPICFEHRPSLRPPSSPQNNSGSMLAHTPQCSGTVDATSTIQIRLIYWIWILRPMIAAYTLHTGSLSSQINVCKLLNLYYCETQSEANRNAQCSVTTRATTRVSRWNLRRLLQLALTAPVATLLQNVPFPACELLERNNTMFEVQ